MNFVRLYTRVLEMLGEESRLAWTLAVANLSLAAAQFAEPILFGRIIDTLAGAQSRGSAPAWTDLLPLRGLGRPAPRPAGAPPAPRRDEQLLRAHPATADELPRHDSLRPDAQDHADRRRLDVVAMARVLPRAFRRVRFAARAAAAVAVPELAAR